MISPHNFVKVLQNQGIEFFTGVPDSLLKDFISYVEENVSREQHITAANEGNAVAIASGYNLATGKIAAVYLQNSGLGNAVNPLTSLADKEVYAIPLLLIIGWRGEPGVHDEPQHIKQGKVTEAMLDVLGVPYVVFSSDISPDAMEEKVRSIVEQASAKSCPCAILVRKGVFEEYVSSPREVAHTLTREEAINIVTEQIGKDGIIVSTTGKISRELYEARSQHGGRVEKDFLTVGSMGHASQIALGIATQKKNIPVYCLDGDGATIMHMGGLATIGWVAPQNFRHIVLNNLAHESVGGQPSAAQVVDLPVVARSCGYALASQATTKEEIVAALDKMNDTAGPSFLEIKVNLSSRPNLGRPKETPVENKKVFMDSIKPL